MVKLIELNIIDENKQEKRYNSFIELAKKCGAVDVSMEFGNGYPQLFYTVNMTDKCNCLFLIPCAKTPSDHRSDKNFLSDVKRSIRLAKTGQCKLAKGREQIINKE